MTTFAILRKFGPFLLIVALAFVILLQRNTITGKAAKLEAANAEIGNLTDANKSLNVTLKSVASRQPDNDAIATAVAAKLNGNTVREVETRTIIERAKANDPAVRAWGDAPVPSVVRDALRAHSQR